MSSSSGEYIRSDLDHEVAPQVIGNATDLSQEQQYVCGINDGHHEIYPVIHAWNPKTSVSVYDSDDEAGQPADQRADQRRPRSKSWRRKDRTADDHDTWPVDDKPRRPQSRRSQSQRRVTLRDRFGSDAKPWRRERSRGRHAEDEAEHAESDPDMDHESGYRYVTKDKDGISRQEIPQYYMDHWRQRGFNDHDIRHHWSMWYVQRDEAGKIMRSDRKGNTRSVPAAAGKGL